MSDPVPDRQWHFYLDDMIQFCNRVTAYTRDLDLSGFTNDAMCFDATVRNLELIGEAATHVPAEIRASHPDIAWRRIIATRNQLVHAYLGIDNDTLWSIIESDVPVLLSALVEMKRRVQS